MNDTTQVDRPKSVRKSRRVSPPKNISEGAPETVQIGAPGFGNVPGLDEDIPATPLTDDGDGDLASITPEEMDEALQDAEIDLEPTQEVDAWLKTLHTHGAGSPVRIEIRELGVGRSDHTKHLRPLRGHIDLADVTKAGSLERAVAVKVNHKPGTYAVQAVDPIGKRRIGSARYVKVTEPEATPDIKSLDETIAKTRKRVTLAEAEAELEMARAELEAARNGSNSALLEEFRRLRMDFAALRQTQPAPSAAPWWRDLVPLVVPKLIERLFAPPAPPPSIESFAPMMQKVMEISMGTQAAHQEALRERENLVLEQMMRMMSKQAGIPPETEPEEESLMGIAGKVIDMMRSSQAAANPMRAPVVAAPTPAPAAAPPKPVTPFVQFVDRLIACAKRGMTPLATAAAASPAWRALSDAARHAIQTGHMDSLEQLFGELDDTLYATVEGAMANEQFTAWYGEVIRALSGAQPAATVSEPATAAAGS